MRSALMRATVSIPLPAETGTTIVMGRDGKLCAYAGSKLSNPQATPKKAERKGLLESIISPLLIVMWRALFPQIRRHNPARFVDSCIIPFFDSIIAD
jgi:hypothetical protein